MIWKRLFKKSANTDAQRSRTALSHVQAPSAEYPAPLDAIRALLVAHSLPAAPGQADDGGWLTFYASSGVDKGVIEVTGNQLNFCNEQVDLERVLRDVGMEALAVQAVPASKDDHTLWTITGANADDFASIIDIVFTGVLGGTGLSESYELTGDRSE